MLSHGSQSLYAVCVVVVVAVAVSVGLSRPATIRGVIRGPSGLVAGRDIETLTRG